MADIEQRLRTLEQFKNDYISGNYPLKSFGPGSIYKNLLKVKAIDIGKIDADSLAAVSQKTGSLRISGVLSILASDIGASISSGMLSFTDTNKGLWLGSNGGTIKFRLGDPSADLIEYNGVSSITLRVTSLRIQGTGTSGSGALPNPSKYFSFIDNASGATWYVPAYSAHSGWAA